MIFHISSTPIGLILGLTSFILLHLATTNYFDSYSYIATGPLIGTRQKYIIFFKHLNKYSSLKTNRSNLVRYVICCKYKLQITDIKVDRQGEVSSLAEV